MADDNLLEDYIEVYLSAFKYVGELVSAPMRDDDISFEQFLILRDIAAGHDLSLSEIAKARHVTRAAISRQIKTLMEHHYMIQVRDPNDGRRQELQLTTSGQALVSRVNQAISTRFAGWIDVIGEPDAQDLLRIMRRVGQEIIAKEQK
ncbi:MarR family winged helix-turn-helix transcriptional regulator [Lacticaseibacillus yichunensis]|uniref:MarR family winged helix-turn-helix transcriptional regulator n=1 Tax=Lacticaseibacillus yichunensis TaxID=2486015 RepID=A0ABW4CPP2_9LACO|nr:MarR family transcriptional regulator [Lacticaseibacillus yichunensis]